MRILRLSGFFAIAVGVGIIVVLISLRGISDAQGTPDVGALDYQMGEGASPNPWIIAGQSHLI